MQGAGCRDARGGHATFSAGEGRREFGFSFGLFLRSSTGRERVEASEFFPPTFFFFLLLHASLLLERSRPPSPLLDILSTRFLCVCTVIRSKRERRKNELSLLHRSTLPLFLLLFLAARHLLLFFSSSPLLTSPLLPPSPFEAPLQPGKSLSRCSPAAAPHPPS